MPKTRKSRTFGEVVRDARQAAGKSQADVAREVGLAIRGSPFTSKHISEIERDAWTPSTAKRAAFVKALANSVGIEADILFYKAGLIPADCIGALEGDDAILNVMRTLRGRIRVWLATRPGE